jgi:murein DD-endopeptidase MepM/ murein hydrolase activator NlpD
MHQRALRVAGGLAAGIALVRIGTSVFGGDDLPVAPPLVVSTAYEERSDTLKSSETLSHLFARHNIIGPELLQLLEAAEPIDPRRVRAGQVFAFRYVLNQPAPERVTVRLGSEQILRLKRDVDVGWLGESQPIYWTVNTEIARGQIRSSLYETVEGLVPDEVLPPAERARLTWDLADGVFGWVVDFTRDNYPGDGFEIAYERLTSDLGDVRFGRILAAKVETRGAENSAYVMTDDRGFNAYYSADGHSLRRAFKLYPAEFRRISSGFSRNRYHPILKQSRPHLGVDYSAASGTPIMATGDGTVVRANRWGGYGIVVVIRHPKGIETRYAHMRSLASGIHAGARVRQSQVIGYVGMSGLATAPHLHYEFLKNGRHVDPRTAVRFGEGDPVPKARRAEFDSLKLRYDRLLAPPAASTIAAGLD